MRAAKRLQTIHLKDKQGRVVSSWQRARVPVPDGISVSLPSPYRGLKPPHEEGRAQPVAGISGFSMTASVDTVLEADQRGLQLDRKMDNLIRAARVRNRRGRDRSKIEPLRTYHGLEYSEAGPPAVSSLRPWPAGGRSATSPCALASAKEAHAGSQRA